MPRFLNLPNLVSFIVFYFILLEAACVNRGFFVANGLEFIFN